MKKLTVNIGQRFNQLTVIEMTGVNSKGFSVAKCRCDCGNEIEAKVAELRSGRRKSCGCARLNTIGEKASTEIIGKKFGRLTVLALDGLDDRSYRMILCACDCGEKVRVRQATVLRGELRSCGCLLDEKRLQNLAVAHSRQIKHGMSGTPMGYVWNSMIQRCYNPKDANYVRYGARGIICCAALQASPVGLVYAIGERPSDEFSIDRIDNDGNYFCGQCGECVRNGWKLNIRWATCKEQSRNRRSNNHVTIDGVTRTVAEWCELTGISRNTFTRRIDAGKNPMTNEPLTQMSIAK